MATDIQQQIASGIYDTTTQQHIKAMSQMWSFDQYNTQPYSNASMIKEDKFDPMKTENMNMFHPFFAQQLSSFAQIPPNSEPRDSPHPSKKKPQPVPEAQKDESYRERRRRNNEAARKSREQRKKNEDNTSRRLDFAQHENFILRQEIQRLHGEIERLKYACTSLTSQLTMLTTNSAQNPSTY